MTVHCSSTSPWGLFKLFLLAIRCLRYAPPRFEEDITSPSQAQGTDENDEEDYQILSKTVVPSEANIGR